MDENGERTRLCAERRCRSLPFGMSVFATLVYLLTLFQLVGIAAGLQYLHGYEPHPIYHGDLKGVCLFNISLTWFADISVLQVNVLISDDGCPLLADFGFVFIVSSSFSMDVEGSRRGTPHWMGPEYFGLCEESTAAERDAGTATAEGDWVFGMTVLVRLPCLSSYSLLDVSKRNSLRDNAPSPKSTQSPNSSFACEVATLAHLTRLLISV